MMTVGLNGDGKAFILDAWQRRVNPLLLMEKLFELNERFNPKIFTIEATAFQKSLRYYLDAESKRRGTYLRIEDYKPSNTKSKEARIRGALQPWFNTGQMFIRERMLDFVEQYMSFGRTDDDHMMDALAQGPQFWKTPRTEAASDRVNRIRQHLMRSRPGITGYGISLPSSRN